MNKAMINLETDDGKLLPVEALVVPKIAAALKSSAIVEAAKLPFISGLKLAQPVNGNQKFEIANC